MMEQTGTMTLTSRTAVALWVCELLGQISDGMWENTCPLDHYKFWCCMDVQIGDESKVTSTAWCRKNGYNFAALFPIVGDRMLAYARMAKAGADPKDRELCSAGEYMPPSFEMFLRERAMHSDEGDYMGKYLARVGDELAKAFYATTYTMRDMKADIKLIKSTMKQTRV